MFKIVGKSITTIYNPIQARWLNTGTPNTNLQKEHVQIFTDEILLVPPLWPDSGHQMQQLS